MKEPYVEVLAKHSGHESCADSREVVREAFDSGMYRLSMSLENKQLECRRCPDKWKAIPKTSLMRDVNGLYVVEDLIHVQKLYARESGDPAIDLEHMGDQGPR